MVWGFQTPNSPIWSHLAHSPPGLSSLRSNSKQLVRNEERNFKEQVLPVHNTEGKVIHPVQASHFVKAELPQFADKTQQDALEFLMTFLPLLQLPRYQGSVLSILQCKSCKYQSLKKEVFKCIEVPMPERWMCRENV